MPVFKSFVLRTVAMSDTQLNGDDSTTNAVDELAPNSDETTPKREQGIIVAVKEGVAFLRYE